MNLAAAMVSVPVTFLPVNVPQDLGVATGSLPGSPSRALYKSIPHPVYFAPAYGYLASVGSSKTATLKAAPSGIASRSWLKIAHLWVSWLYQTPMGWSL